MKIQELPPMTAEEYVSVILHHPPTTEVHPDPIELFRPAVEAAGKMAFAPYFWFIADYTTLTVADIDPGVDHHVAQGKQEWLDNGPQTTMRLVHPDDCNMKYAYDSFLEQYLGRLSPERRRHQKFNTYFRILDKQGLYRWYMVQMPDYHYDSNGNIVYAFRVAYDISHLKKEGVAMMTMLDHTDPYNQVLLCKSNNHHRELVNKILQLTDREMEVIRLLSTGQLSKEIAGNLSISPHTVESHKHNVFRKTGTKSANELVAFAIRSGIV